MNFTDLTTELVARGAPADAVRNGRRINRAYKSIVNSIDWPFTVVEATGTANAGSVVVSDMRKVILVGDISSTGTIPGFGLQRVSLEVLVDELFTTDLGVTGSPTYWYLDEPTYTIKAFPKGGTIYARYHKRVVDLAGTDIPIFDAAYHDLIADQAMVYVLLDNDEPQAATAAQQLFNANLAPMVQQYQSFSLEPTYLEVIDPYDG